MPLMRVKNIISELLPALDHSEKMYIHINYGSAICTSLLIIINIKINSKIIYLINIYLGFDFY